MKCTTADKLSRLISCDLTLENNFLQENAMKLNFDTKSPKKFSVSPIDNFSRLILGIRMDYNRVTEEKLLLTQFTQ
jgi:hypothetical protein